MPLQEDNQAGKFSWNHHCRIKWLFGFQRKSVKNKSLLLVLYLTLTWDPYFHVSQGKKVWNLSSVGDKEDDLTPPGLVCTWWVGGGREGEMAGVEDRVALEMSWIEEGADGPGRGQCGPSPCSSAPDGVCAAHTRCHSRKPCVTASMPNTTRESRDKSIASWSRVLRKACDVTKGKTSYFKSWLQGRSKDSGSWPQAALGNNLDKWPVPNSTTRDSVPLVWDAFPKTHTLTHSHMLVIFFLKLPPSFWCIKWSEVKSLSRVQLCDPADCSLQGSSVHGIRIYILMYTQGQKLLL